MMKKFALALSFLVVPVAAYADGGAGVELPWWAMLVLTLFIIAAFAVVISLFAKAASGKDE